jgi:hypothetical protein
MNTLQFHTDRVNPAGLRERDFTVAGVPGVLWSPVGTTDRPAPLVLMGHGGGNHKKSPAMAGRARLLVAECGFHVAVLDAPGHGERPSSARDERQVDAILDALDAGRPIGPLVVRHNLRLAGRAVPEWRAALDALQRLPEIGPDGPVGWFGLNLGTAVGVPLVAVEPRITAAVFGMFWADPLAAAARRIGIPVEYVMQWDNEHVPRAEGLALFDAFASAEKSLHANPGGHHQVPRFESDSAVRFFARHLTTAT